CRGVEQMASKSPVNNQIYPRGVEAHGQSLRICFSYKGKRYRETIKLPISKQNIKYAEALRTTILNEIKNGTFNYAKYFPESKHGFGTPCGKEIGELAKEFIEKIGPTVQRSTKERYQWSLMDFCNIYGIKRPIETLSPRALDKCQKKLFTGRCGTTINSNLRTVNAFLKWLFDMEYIPLDLSKYLSKVKQSKPNIDPFSVEEFNDVLSNCMQLQHKNILAIFVYTGIRTGELCALAWEDVDFENGTILIRRSIYKNRGLKTTKTDEERYVNLFPPAMKALESQYKLTGWLPEKNYNVELPGNKTRTEQLHFVFNPKVVRAQKDSDYDYYGLRAICRIWSFLCKKSGVKYRNQYQLRHTYASWMITHADVNIHYLAQQMGHTDITMIIKVYAKWLHMSNKKESDRAWDKLSKICCHK
ncbi:site-specific integrase, partial [Vibrio sp. FNV 38]|nr:site-specific integrase [Vibrio sp. FNV 38]